MYLKGKPFTQDDIWKGYMFQVISSLLPVSNLICGKNSQKIDLNHIIRQRIFRFWKCPLQGHPRSTVPPPTRARESCVKFWHSIPVLTQLAHLCSIFWHSSPVSTQMYICYGSSGVGLYMLLDLCPCLAGSFQHSSHICVNFFGIQVP